MHRNSNILCYLKRFPSIKSKQTICRVIIKRYRQFYSFKQINMNMYAQYCLETNVYIETLLLLNEESVLPAYMRLYCIRTVKLVNLKMVFATRNPV